MHLEQSWSPRYNSMLKIMILENLAEKPPSPPPRWEETQWETQLMSHMENTYGPHTTNPHQDSSYPNILYRIPTLKSETGLIHFKPFTATLGSAGRTPPAWVRVSTTRGLPLVTKDYLPETITHLVKTPFAISPISLREKSQKYFFK